MATDCTAPSSNPQDEGLTKMDPSRLPSLRPYFKRDGGTVTAGNASPLTDGAAALVVASAEAARVGWWVRGDGSPCLSKMWSLSEGLVAIIHEQATLRPDANQTSSPC